MLSLSPIPRCHLCIGAPGGERQRSLSSPRRWVRKVGSMGLSLFEGPRPIESFVFSQLQRWGYSERNPEELTLVVKVRAASLVQRAASMALIMMRLSLPHEADSPRSRGYHELDSFLSCPVPCP